MFKIITITFDRNKRGFDEEVLTQIILNKQVTSYHVQFFEDGAEKYKRGLKGVFIPDRFRCNVKNEDLVPFQKTSFNPCFSGCLLI